MNELDKVIFEALGGEDRRQFIPTPNRERALGIAHERAERIYRLFEEFRVSPESHAEEDLKGLPFRYVESPREGFRERGRLESRAEGQAEVIRLRHELRHPELLLAGQVTDFLLAESEFREAGNSWRTGRVPLPVVQVVWDQNVRAGAFPWKVIVRGDERSPQAAAIIAAADQIGIGVDLAPEMHTRLQGRCTAGTGGMTGSLGGVLQSGPNPLLSTCAHVLASGCQSAFFHTQPSGFTSQPDTALLHSGSPCFTSSASAPCQPMSDAGIDQAIKNRTPVVMQSDSRGSRRGVLLCRVSAVPIGQNYCRFPHVQILAWPTAVNRALSLFDLAFSAPGDSGNWVFGEGDGRWVGQVVGGMDDLRISYATEARPLLDFLRASIGYPALSPERFT